MIKIRRTSCPLCLNKQEHDFVEDDYKGQEVKLALLEMQYGKCCYCEKNIRSLHSVEREVEHYIPKHACKDNRGNIEWHIANRWDNLLYSCKPCNSGKGIKHPYDRTGQLQIIDPTKENIDPEDHIDFKIIDFIIVYSEKVGSSLGRSTIRKLKLDNRPDLWSAFRKIKLHIDSQIYELIDAITNNDTINQATVTDDLKRATSAHQPHAAFVRKYISNRIEEINAKKNDFEFNCGRPFQEIEIDICKGYETAI